MKKHNFPEVPDRTPGPRFGSLSPGRRPPEQLRAESAVDPLSSGLERARGEVGGTKNKARYFSIGK